MAKQVTLLDLVFSESHQNLTLSHLGRSAKSFEQDEYISLNFFTKVINQIEDKLQEFEHRLENKEQMERLNERLNMSNMTQHVNNTQYSQNQKSKVHLNDQNEESLHSRLNLFEKRLKQMEDKISKLQKEDEQFKKDLERKLEEQLKRGDHSLDKFSRQSKELIGRIEDMTDHQKDLYQNIKKVQDDLNLQITQCTIHRQELYDKSSECQNALEVVQHLAQKSNEDLQDHQSSLTGIENDLILILKYYKDILNKIFNIELKIFENK